MRWTSRGSIWTRYDFSFATKYGSPSFAAIDSEMDPSDPTSTTPERSGRVNHPSRLPIATDDATALAPSISLRRVHRGSFPSSPCSTTATLRPIPNRLGADRWLPHGGLFSLSLVCIESLKGLEIDGDQDRLGHPPRTQERVAAGARELVQPRSRLGTGACRAGFHKRGSSLRS